ncbi:outer membrane protein assembly factor BamA [Celeribacter marinus]|uniref:Outer membrane protein assembly factor BamA n=1 Tax=Celeribacter marinus TaxID=1397108 RepID=A0A0N9ZME0_9RHOB|nr:outer membrane protein assembly factor BamA [Celeribacter marinus]ALI54456.1 outer membrane protein assembly factor YaeT precursor [Celeribacter marinus]SFK77393.1 Beta-barrel assembly machine subunit BamA [Celeribacter marinus]
MKNITRDTDKRLMSGAGKALALSLSALALTTTAYTVIPRAAVAQDYAFSSVVVEGNTRVGSDTILSYAGIVRGQPISAAALNDAYQRIVASGLFESVEIVPGGNRLAIKVTEFPMVSRVNIEGNRTIDDAALGSLIRTSERRVFSPSVAEADAAAITEAYAAKGQLIATVTPQIIRRSGNRVDVVFDVTEGKGVEVERLSFVGNRSFSDARLRRVLATKQAGLLRFIVGRDTYDEERIGFDKRVLTDFYTSRGYVDFSVLSANAEFSRERNAHFVTFSVREGQSYDFANTTIVSQIDGVDAADYQRAMNLRAGQTYSPVAIENVISRIEKMAQDKGVDFVRVEPRVTRHERDLTLDVEFVLSKGPRVFVERIDIEGNATTLDRIVRRQFRIVEGDPFNPREIREAASRIRALNFFSNADVNAREGSSADQVVVDVNVDEAPTGSFSFGANYSVSDNVNLVASFSERNFLGRGQTVSADLTTKLDDGTLRFNFVEPAFLGRDVALGFGIGLASTQPSYALHTTRTAYVTPSLTFPVSERGRLRLDYRFDLSEMVLPSGTASSSLPSIVEDDYDLGRQSTQSVGYTYSFDTRRNGLNPDAGVLLSFGQEFAGLGGDVKYVKSTAEVRGQMKVFNDQVTLLGVIEGGAISSSDGTMVNDRFFNSSDVIRGFEPGGIGPRDGATDTALGGNFYAVARVEAQFPLGLPEEYGIKGGVFLDHGAVWGLDDETGIEAGSADRTFRTVAGASIFWITPIGPLRFNFSKALDKQDFDKEQSFDLTISTEF